MTDVQPQRRTQRERREATVAKLVDAGIQAVSELGYSGASVREVCARAGVSYGALFRHFENMSEFMAAVFREAGRRQLEEFRRRFGETSQEADPLAAVLLVNQELSRSPINMVFYELILAARTDAELRDRLRPSLESYSADLGAEVAALPGAEEIPENVLAALASTVRGAFDSEALIRMVFPRPEVEDLRVPLLVALFRGDLAFPRAEPDSA